MRASIQIDPNRTIGQIDPLIYGQFLSRRRWVADEALFAPDHPDADQSGLRRTVVEAIEQMAPTVVRWPGGCTGTSYDWRDGTGPRQERQRTIDAHFGYDVGNGFGTAEFVHFCRRLGAEPLINLSIGLGTLRDAVEWIEYANAATPSRFANLRRQHGHDEPFDVRYWQIGNEEWGAHEIGQRSPTDYAWVAREWAKTIKKQDPALKVLAVGAWHPRMALDWNSVVLDEAWPHIDYITAHQYWDFNSTTSDDAYDAIAAAGYLEEQTIVAMGGLIDLVAHEKGSTRRPKLAFTEWNARDRGQREMSDKWRAGNSQYRLVDALAVAGFLNAMQRQCNVVGLGAFAQTINVVGALVVTPDHVLRETVYWPLVMQRHLSGPASVDACVDCDGYTAAVDGREIAGIPFLDVGATLDDATGRLFVSIVNRHRTEEIVTRISTRDSVLPSTARLHRLWHDDPFARNTLETPDTIVPSDETIELAGGSIELSLSPHSYSILELALPRT